MFLLNSQLDMKKISLLLLLFAAFHINAQDPAHFKSIVKELSSAKYQGRGYAMDGANKAGKYLQKEFQKAGADTVILQPFTLDINTFPGKMKLSVDGRKLTPGTEFTLREYSPGVCGEYPLYYVDTLHYDAAKIFTDLALPQYKDAFVVCDFWFTYKHKEDFKRLQSKDGASNAGLIYTWQTPLKFYKAYGEKVVDKPILWVSSAFPKDARSIKADIENEFLDDYECFNVIAKVEGIRHDGCYVFTAHYDHLGKLGKILYFPGANDNASGTATIVTLAAYYAQNKPQYDMYFVAFSGEDANLRGSEFFANHPVVPLEQIRYLVNIDMIGDNNPMQYCEAGKEGMRGFGLFEKINTEKHYFESLNRGELAANSDHYPFAKRHVPCIFLMNEGGDAYQYYHTAQDNMKTVALSTYEPVFKLITDFIEEYSRNYAPDLPLGDISSQAERRAVVAQGTPELYNGHPTTVLFDDSKTIFCTWSEGHGGRAAFMGFSHDGGLTWTTQNAPKEWDGLINCPSAYLLTDKQGKQRLFVFATEEFGKAYREMAYSVSEDGGKTWSEVKHLGMPCIMAFTSIIRLKNGDYLGMYHRGNSEQDRNPLKVWQSISHDGGLNWDEPVLAGEMPGRSPCEPCVFYSPDKKMLTCVARENQRKGCSLMMFSNDEGKTWTPLKETPLGLTGDRHAVRQLPDGRYIFVFRDMAPGSPTKGNFVAWVGTYSDIVNALPGQYRVKLLHNYSGVDCGYPGLELLPDGTIVATTYLKYHPGPEKHSVVSVRFKIEELDSLF